MLGRKIPWRRLLLLAVLLSLAQIALAMSHRWHVVRSELTRLGDDGTLLHYFVAATFLLSGLATLMRKNGFGSASSFVRKLDVSSDLKARLDAACRRRECDEGLPTTTLSVSFGAAELLLAIVAARTDIPLGMLFAFMYCPLAFALTLAYFRLQRAGTKRYASLEVRDTVAVAPPYVWAIAAIATVMPLLSLPSDPAGALLAATSGIVILILGNRVASLPALLRGDDLIVERFLDVRLREGRTSYLLAIAVMPGVSFEVFSSAPFATFLSHIGWDVEIVALAVILRHLLVLMHKPPSDAERYAWSHATT